MGYDVVANALLDEVHSTYGPAAYQQMIKGVALRMAAPHASRLAGARSSTGWRPPASFCATGA